MNGVSDLVKQITSLTMESINISMVVLLVGIGFLLKHGFKMLDNKNIPAILMVLGMMIAVAVKVPFDPQKHLISTLIEGMASGFVATIVHANARKIYENYKHPALVVEHNRGSPDKADEPKRDV